MVKLFPNAKSKNVNSSDEMTQVLNLNPTVRLIRLSPPGGFTKRVKPLQTRLEDLWQELRANKIKCLTITFITWVL